MSWSIPLAIVAVIALAGTALAAVSFSNVGAKVAPWSWSNWDPSIGGNTNGQISAIVVPTPSAAPVSARARARSSRCSRPSSSTALGLLRRT